MKFEIKSFEKYFMFVAGFIAATPAGNLFINEVLRTRSISIGAGIPNLALKPFFMLHQQHVHYSLLILSERQTWRMYSPGSFKPGT
jgi:hypothetical protein